MQQEFCRDIRRIYTAYSPTLRTVEDTFGQGTANAWLVAQLFDLSEFSGAKNKLATDQMKSLVRTMLNSSPELRVVEMMHFFQKFKAGDYGNFYGRVDALAITEALHSYRRYRQNVLDAIQREDHMRRQKERWQREERESKRLTDILRYCNKTMQDYLAAIRPLWNMSLTENEIKQRIETMLNQWVSERKTQLQTT